MTDLPFDVHDHRHALKQLEDTGDKSLWRNEVDLACPVCDEPFVYLIAMERPTTVRSADARPACVARQSTDPSVAVFLHESHGDS
ncbi:MAG: flagella cluster protein [Halorientalis sp.]